jgi:transposase
MGKPYSEDLRERVIGAAQDGATIPEIAEQFGVSISSVVRFRRLYRDTGSVNPAKFGGYRGYALAAHEELVRELVAEQSDITLAELRATEKVTVGQSSISRFLHHLNAPHTWQIPDMVNLIGDCSGRNETDQVAFDSNHGGKPLWVS